MELPQYTLRPSTNRMVAPWILKLLGLSILFYAGIYFNVKYMLDMSIPAYINLFIFAFLIVLVLTQIILYKVKFGKYKYLFYTNRIDYEGKKTETFLFNNFQSADLKQNVFDKMFGTGSIRLSKDFIIGPVANVKQVQGYLDQLVAYYNKTQQRYKAQQASVQQAREVAK
jgi:hypothetical protein